MQNRKICIITGANSGIGKQAAAQIADKQYHVILACRNAGRGEAAVEEIRAQNGLASVEMIQVDMGLRDSVRGFAETVKSRYPVIDVLIHNAAIFDVAQKTREQTSEGVETYWSVNHLGPVYLTELLMDRLLAAENGRIITVASKGLVAMPGLKVDLTDPEFAGKKFNVTKAYYQAKRAQVMYTYWLAERLAPSSATANSIRVTAVKVDLSRHPGLSTISKWAYKMKSRMSISPEEMAKTYTWLATSKDLSETSGKYFDEKRSQVKSAPYTYDRQNIESVMRLTAKYIPEVQEVITSGGKASD